MKSNYLAKVDQMINNYETIKKDFKWEADLSKHLVALNYAIKGTAYDGKQLKDTRSHLRKETGAFSPFRGTMMFPICGLINATSERPIQKLDDMIKNLPILKSVGFKNSMYLPTALYALSTVYTGHDVEGYGQKAMLIYKEMKQNHPFLTSGDDYALAILLAGSGHNPDNLERYYKALNDIGFAKSNGLQMLSHILSFNTNEISNAVSRCQRIYDAMKSEKLKVTQSYYPAIGLISLLENDDAIKDLVEVASYLRNQKKYKRLGKGMNILMASAIITSEYVKNTDGDVVSTAVSVSIQSIIAAQQAAMITAVSASNAAAT